MRQPPNRRTDGRTVGWRQRRRGEDNIGRGQSNKRDNKFNLRPSRLEQRLRLLRPSINHWRRVAGGGRLVRRVIISAGGAGRAFVCSGRQR